MENKLKMDNKLRDAARDFVYPNSQLLNKKIFDDKAKKEYGELVWKEACIKARTEYYFGSRAVKW